jgi:nucleoid-associated protein YgaU
MGIFDFVAEAGQKLFGKDDTTEQAGQPIKDLISHNGIDISKLEAEYADGCATLSGCVPTQVDKEKAVLITGNLRSVAKVVDNLTTEETTEMTSDSSGEAVAPDWQSRVYTVKSGDNLSKIAKEMYGDANKYHQIFEANKPMLSDPGKIFPGQVLRIP